MTNNENTVAVPVELLKRYLASSDSERWPQMADEFRKLLPKPKPRLVAVDLDWTDSAAEVDLPDYLARQPDLLTLLDEAISGGCSDDSMIRVDAAKEAIRAALGVTDD